MQLEMEFKHIVYVWLILNRNVNEVDGIENTETFRMSDRVYTCSKWLSSIIDSFCNNEYKIVKRDTSLIIDKLTPKGSPDSTNKIRLLGKERWRRVRRQVASECCERPCTVENIIMYCPDDAKVLQENPHIFD